MAQVLTCLSRFTDGWSFAVAVQGNNSNVVISVWDQLLQQGRGGGPWYQNLGRGTEHVRNKSTDHQTSGQFLPLGHKL